MSRLRLGDKGVEGKDIITDLVLQRGIFDSRWFARLDNWVDQNPRQRQNVGRVILYVPFVASVIILLLFRMLDIDQLVARRPVAESRGRAAAARWPHKPKVEGSNPSPATKSIDVSEKRTIIVAMRVDPFVEVVAGSVKDTCSECGHPVWLAPSSHRQMERGPCQVVCIECAMPLLSQSPRSRWQRSRRWWARSGHGR